ncbi:ATP-dependent zinc protease [Halorhodospira halochloris]|uniref:ATP-dependent zinc protease family protein n=1 Tax=Halorhodospira halochloris TaxID=1052 RepID=UPI001EE784A6|nr:RimK/LysX family protein [Halorhodospira halochloris]MCG5549072.1 RimK/LysX family protein [Halorhodospira halochloris]
MALRAPIAGLLTIACGLLAGTGCGGAVWIDEEVPERFDERFDNVDDKLAALGEIETQQLEKHELLTERIGALENELKEMRQAAESAQLARISGSMEQLVKQRGLLNFEVCRSIAALSSQDDGDSEQDNDCPEDERLRNNQQVSGERMYVFGEVEPIQLDPPGLEFDARVDSGANTSSIDARNIEEFERDGEPWVRFEIKDRDSGDRLAIERPKKRTIRISQAAGTEERPVVELHATIGELSERVEFTLTDRSHLSYPILVGRNMLRDVVLVDVGLQRATTPATPDEDDLEAIEADMHVEDVDADENDAEEDDTTDDDSDNGADEDDNDDVDNGEDER